MASPAQIIEQGSLQRQQNRFQQGEEQRIRARDAQATLYEQALQNPNLAPEDRKALLSQHAALFQPHEAPDLFQRLAGLIKGQQQQATQAQPAAATSAPAVDPNAAPPAPIVRDPLGIPYSDPKVAAAASAPMHPMSTDHPVLGRFREALDAIGGHLKGFQQPVQPTAPDDVLARTYKSPQESAAEIQRITLGQQGQQALNLEAERRKRFMLTMTPENRFLAKYAEEHGYDSASDIPLEEQSTALQEFKKANTPLKVTTAMVADPDSSTGFSKITMNQLTGEVTSTIPGVTPPRGFIPTQRVNRSTDQFGNVTTSVASTTPQVPGMNAPSIGKNGAPISTNSPKIPAFVTPSFTGFGLVSPGNIDLNSRPKIKNSDGSTSTVFSMGFNVDGKEVLVPGVGDGITYPLRKLTTAEALDQYKKTGKNLGTFDSPAASDAYAASLHKDQEQALPRRSAAIPQTAQQMLPKSTKAPVIPTQPGPLAAAAPELNTINAQIQANKGKAGAPNRKAVAKSALVNAPVSTSAPQVPKQLDENGQIPASDPANPQVREFAQQLLDDRDVDKIPAKAKAPAAALARQYGWEQGKFTPREQGQIRTAVTFLKQLQNSPSLDVLNDSAQRYNIAKVLSDKTGDATRILASNLLSPEAKEFIRNYNIGIGTVQGLSGLTRSGRPVEAGVKRLIQEFPNVLQSSDAADAKARIDNLLKEVEVSQQTTKQAKTEAGKQSKQSLASRLDEALGK